MFGYYIEVRNTHKDKVPADWIRKQTLTGAERYITAELKEYEEKILGAESKILAIEQEMYAALLAELTRSSPLSRKTRHWWLRPRLPARFCHPVGRASLLPGPK